MPTYIVDRTASGAETVTDQLAGTAVAFAGPTGKVSAAACATLITTTFLLKGRNSGKEIIPNGSSGSVPGAITALDMQATHFLFEGQVEPGEPLELTITHAAAGSCIVGVRTT